MELAGGPYNVLPATVQLCACYRKLGWSRDIFIQSGGSIVFAASWDEAAECHRLTSAACLSNKLHFLLALALSLYNV